MSTREIQDRLRILAEVVDGLAFLTPVGEAPLPAPAEQEITVAMTCGHRQQGRLGVGRAMVELVAGDVIRWKKVRDLRRRWSSMAPAGRRPSKHSLDEAVRLAVALPVRVPTHVRPEPDPGRRRIDRGLGRPSRPRGRRRRFPEDPAGHG